jgi:hypothetical protein
LNITTQYLFHCAFTLFPIRVRNTIPSSTTRAHSNVSPNTARILPTAGHRPIPSDKPTLLPTRQASAMATPIPLPSRITRRLRTTARSQRVHDSFRRLQPLLVQHPLHGSGTSKHHSSQRLHRHSQKNAHPRKSLHNSRVFSLFRNYRILPHKLLQRRNTPRSNITAGLMGRHLHRHSCLRHICSGKPKWWYIAIGSTAAITGAAVYTLIKPTWDTGVFVASAIALAIACMIVLSVSVYIFVRIWKETLKDKKRKRR